MTHDAPVLESNVPTANSSAPGMKPPRSYGRILIYVALLGSLFLLPFVFSSPLQVEKLNRFLTLALFAVSVDLIWGYTGLLSLGQGLYFGIGAYFVAYSLSLQRANMRDRGPESRYFLGGDMGLPEFMFQGQLNEVPAGIAPLVSPYLAIFLAVAVPTLLAGAFGWIVFRRRIKGVYFSLITQALVYAMFTLVKNQRSYTGGVDGQPGLPHLEIFGFAFRNQLHLNLLITITLCFFALLSYALVHSKFGKILTAIRDNEFRVQALGYDTAMYKTFVFALAGLMAGAAGALYCCSIRSIGPDRFSIEESILVVIFVAGGGRGTLFGPILGTLVISFGQDKVSSMGEVVFPGDFLRWLQLDDDIVASAGAWFSLNFTKLWPILLGALFVVIVLFLPDGIVGGLFRLSKWLKRIVLREKRSVAAESTLTVR
jgi:urea transport system permease protein